MSSYDFLAGCYDRLTYDVDYSAWADYVEQQFAKHPLPGNTILDLACGTGSLTRELALRGYEMIGADQSPEMLAEATEKNRGIAPVEPIFLCQPMEKLDLYGTIDACVCCLDSVNYVTDPKKLARAFQRVCLFLMPGGMFLFDINTCEKLEGLDGQVFLDERGRLLRMAGGVLKAELYLLLLYGYLPAGRGDRAVEPGRGDPSGAGLHHRGTDQPAGRGRVCGYQDLGRAENAFPETRGAARLFYRKKGNTKI